MKNIQWFANGLLVCLLFFGGIFSVSQAEAATDETETQSSSPLLNPKKYSDLEQKDIHNLPVYQSDAIKNLDDVHVQLPQSGEFTGVITRQTVVYEKTMSFSLLLPLDATVQVKSDGEPYTGLIYAPEKVYVSKFPKPTISDANLLTGILLGAEAEITIDPPATLRIPLPENQWGNTEVTLYYYDEAQEKFVLADGDYSEDGKGYLVPITKIGLYALYDAKGTTPEKSTFQTEAAADDTETTDAETEDESEEQSADESDTSDQEETDEPDSEEEEDAESETETEQADETESEPTEDEADEAEEDSSESEADSEKTEQKVYQVDYADIGGHWANEYIGILAEAGLATGDSGFVFGPDKPATRAELIRMLVEHRFDRDSIDTCLDTYMPSPFTPVFFTDVPQNHKYAAHICVAALEKMTTGLTDGSFAPDRPITRAEALKLLYDFVGEPEELNLAQNPFDDVSSTDWFTRVVLRAVADGIAKGFTVQEGDSEMIIADSLYSNDQPAEVKKMQQILTKLQFYNGPIDGNLGGDLRQSLLLFQLSRGIVSNPNENGAGNAGPSTISRLNEEIGKNPTNVIIKQLFRPHQSVTRAELAKFTTGILNLK